MNRGEQKAKRGAAYDHGYMAYLSQNFVQSQIDQFTQMLQDVAPNLHKIAAAGWAKAAKDMLI
jgi:hypothetical protein